MALARPSGPPTLREWSPWASAEAPVSLTPVTSVFALDSCKQRWEIPGAEALFNHLLYCLSGGDSAIGKSQFWSEPGGPEMQDRKTQTEGTELTEDLLT